MKAVTSSFIKLTAKIACGYHTTLTQMVISVWACGSDIPNFVDCNAKTLVGPGLLKSGVDEVADVLTINLS